MTDYTDAYRDLLIKQYWDQPNARAEIELQAGTWETVRDGLDAFGEAFDLDLAVGAQLDLIGEIVGLRRAPPFTADDDYRFYLRVRIASNVASAFMVSDDRISVQDVVNAAFEGLAYVIDRKDMTLHLYVDVSIDSALVAAVRDADLLPKPQGVRYDQLISYDVDGTFGFSNNSDAKGFASKFDPGREGGVFARRII